MSGRFAPRLGAVRNEGRAVVKEMAQEELKGKMDQGDDFSRPPSGTPPTSPEPHRAFYFALEGLVDRFVSLHYGLAVILVFVGAKFVAQGKPAHNVRDTPVH